jgi:hypothetical protein
LSGPQFTPRVFIQSPESRVIASIARDWQTNGSPLMNTDDTDHEIGDRKGKIFNHQGHEEKQGRWQSAVEALSIAC